MITVSLTVNGRSVTADVEPRQHLADFLREHELLTGTHLGCEHGVCGACTVLLDGAPARSCITYPAALDGAEVTTIEGFEADDVMARLRAAFSAEHALQCGYCTPGMLVMARDIVLRLPGADAARIRTELAGNLCRCTGYVGIVRAIEQVMTERSGAEPVNARRAIPQIRPVALTREVARGEPGAAVQVTHAKVTEGDDGATRIEQSFTVGFPRETVWAFFQNPRKVVACMPGASLSEVGDDGDIRGQMRIKLGPMAASFSGEGKITENPQAWSGTITGRGTDQGSATRARGRVDYALHEEPGGDGTRVDIVVAYTLIGPLAQVSRGGIARDLAARMTRAFAENLEARLAGREAPAGAGELKAGSLLFSAFMDWLKQLFRRG